MFFLLVSSCDSNTTDQNRDVFPKTEHVSTFPIGSYLTLHQHDQKKGINTQKETNGCERNTATHFVSVWLWCILSPPWCLAPSWHCEANDWAMTFLAANPLQHKPAPTLGLHHASQVHVELCLMILLLRSDAGSWRVPQCLFRWSDTRSWHQSKHPW